MAKKEKKQTVVIHNLKSNNYRQMHVDGALGSITPTGYLNINFYGQRNVIPKGTRFEWLDNGTLVDGDNNLEGSLTGIVREFEFGAYMDIKTATSLKNFIDKKIKEYNKLIKQQEKGK